MNRLVSLCLASISLIIFSCQEQSPATEGTTEIREETSSVDTTIRSVIPRPVIYRDFHHENNLRNGYQFGMTLSEWNKHLASLAESGTVKELSRINFVDGPGTGFAIGSYRAFFPVDTSNGIQSSRQGFFISGLFASPKSHGDTAEVFRVNGQETEQPVLIGIQVDCAIPDYRINEAIRAMVDKDELQPLAGGRLPYTTNEPLDVRDFEDIVAEGFGRMNRETGHESSDERYAKMELTDRTLLQCPRFYSVIELTEKRSAEVLRDANYRVSFIRNAYRTYHLVQKVYSKTQSNLNIEKYMTVDELENYRNASETRNLIEQTR